MNIVQMPQRSVLQMQCVSCGSDTFVLEDFKGVPIVRCSECETEIEGVRWFEDRRPPAA